MMINIRNSFLWFHILAGVYLCKLFLMLGVSDQLAVLSVLTVAITWEGWEYAYGDIIETYGNKKRFFLDAIQDIVGALLAAIGVVI